MMGKFLITMMVWWGYCTCIACIYLHFYALVLERNTVVLIQLHVVSIRHSLSRTGAMRLALGTAQQTCEHCIAMQDTTLKLIYLGSVYRILATSLIVSDLPRPSGLSSLLNKKPFYAP